MINQQLAGSSFDSPEEVVRWMGAVQAQDFRNFQWAVGVRMKNPSLRRIGDALRAGTLVRTHILRPTWHLVPADNLRGMLMLTGKRVASACYSYARSAGIGAELFTRGHDRLEKILSGRALTKEEIGKELEDRGYAYTPSELNGVLMTAEAEGIVCGGGEKCHERHSYVLLEESIPPVSLTKEEALVRLTESYFRSHSPATSDDFVWWSGLTKSEAKKGIALAADLLVERIISGRTFYLHGGDGPAVATENLCLLPPYDEFLISYKDRSDCLEKALYHKAFNSWGIFYPVVAYNGRIVGNWKADRERNVEISWFEGKAPCGSGPIGEAIDRYRRFHNE